MLVPVREPGTNWLLFLYDPDTDTIEVQRRGIKTRINLGALKAQARAQRTTSTTMPQRRHSALHGSHTASPSPTSSRPAARATGPP